MTKPDLPANSRPDDSFAAQRSLPVSLLGAREALWSHFCPMLGGQGARRPRSSAARQPRSDRGSAEVEGRFRKGRVEDLIDLPDAPTQLKA